MGGEQDLVVGVEGDVAEVRGALPAGHGADCVGSRGAAVKHLEAPQVLQHEAGHRSLHVRLHPNHTPL